MYALFILVLDMWRVTTVKNNSVAFLVLKIKF